jgi:monoterpene epsilon-lactone hydrolase
MPADFALEQSARPRIAIETMDEAGAVGAVRMALRRLDFRISQLLVNHVMRTSVRLLARDDEAATRYLARHRALHQRLDVPSRSAMIEAEAIRQAGPGLSLPAPPTPSEWFAPKTGKTRGHVFYVHGGSFIAERSPRITVLVAKFAAAAGAKVYAPNYRLAPEHPCPAAVEDIKASWRWFKHVYGDEPVVALAESAGAAILLAALQQLRDEGEAPPEAILLLSPWVDVSLQSWSVVAASLAGTTPYTMESLALMAQLYLKGRSATDPVASPIFGSFEAFPPMLIHASRGDILYDDAVRLAEKVREARGDLTLRLWTAETHVWERTISDKARQSIALGAEFIRRHLDD